MKIMCSYLVEVFPDPNWFLWLCMKNAHNDLASKCGIRLEISYDPVVNKCVGFNVSGTA